MKPFEQYVMCSLFNDQIHLIFFLYSYDRIQPDTWSGAYLCWGKENKEAPLRTACPPGVPLDLVSNFEIKSFDGCANPHLGLAAIVAAGIDGLRRHLKLPEPIGMNSFMPGLSFWLLFPKFMPCW
jgi:glutamine synthetase